MRQYRLGSVPLPLGDQVRLHRLNPGGASAELGPHEQDEGYRSRPKPPPPDPPPRSRDLR